MKKQAFFGAEFIDQAAAVLLAQNTPRLNATADLAPAATTTKKAKRPALLNFVNSKTIKGESEGFLTGVLYLAPADASGYEVCPMAKLAQCVHECLNVSGFHSSYSKDGKTFTTPAGELPDNAVQRCRIERTRYFHESRPEFLAQLVREIEAFIKRAAKLGLTPVLRLNGTSDLRWEHIPVVRAGVTYPHMFAAFPDLQAYDYTKISNRRIAGIENYKLCYSFSAAPGYLPHVQKAMAAGLNIVVVFRKDLPAEFLGRPVVNGDKNDLRFLDPAGVVVGLKAKGRAKKSTSPFVVDMVNFPRRRQIQISAPALQVAA